MANVECTGASLRAQALPRLGTALMVKAFQVPAVKMLVLGTRSLEPHDWNPFNSSSPFSNSFALARTLQVASNPMSSNKL